MKLLLVSTLLLFSFGCDSKSPGTLLVPEEKLDYPQDLSHINSSKKNGCFRLGNTYEQSVYLYLDIDNVEAIEFTSSEKLGTSHVTAAYALASDGRHFHLRDLVENYKDTDQYLHLLPQAEEIVALKVTGYSNYPGDGGGRQRVDVNVYTTDRPSSSVIKHYHCDLRKMDPGLDYQIEEAFNKSIPHYKIKN